jgi:hypothetical protein
MLTKIVVGALGVFSGLSLSSCYTAYMPNPVFAPLLTKEGQADIAISVQPTNWGNLQAAYAFTDHLAIYSGLSGKPGTPHSPSSISNVLAEAGLGYFTATKATYFFEAFAGAGWGSVKVVENGADPFWYYPQGGPWVDSTQATFFRSYLQFDAGYKRDHLLIGSAIRLVSLNASSFNTVSHDYVQNQGDSITLNHSGSQNAFFVEPTVFVKYDVQLRPDDEPIGYLTLELGVPLRLHPSLLESSAILAAGFEIPLGSRQKK